MIIRVLSAIITCMVLVTILGCSLMSIALDDPNAADEWNEYFQQIKSFEYPYIDVGTDDDPRDFHDEWTSACQSQYEEFAPFIKRAHEIAVMDHCDWELDYSKGFDLRLPHMSQLRDVQLLLRFSMYGDIENGNTSSAIDGMNSLIGITQHNNTTETIIGSLVSASGFQLASEEEQLIDGATDLGQLDAMLEQVEAFDAFDPFGIRANIGHEGESVANWLNSPEFDTNEPWLEGLDSLDEGAIAQYSSAMSELTGIFQMTDQNEANAALLEWDLKIESLEFGLLAKLLCPAMSKLLDSAFTNSLKVEQFKDILQQKIDMLRNPNAASYFLKAVEAYNELDSEERMKAIEQGDFTVLAEPLTLLSIACSMPVKQITLANTPETPPWIAPIYSLALDCIARGTKLDNITILQLVGHLSQQERFAASILAAKLYAHDWGVSLQKSTQEFKDAVDNAQKQIPSADAFMLLGNANRDRDRLIKFYEIESPWEPSKANVLAMSITIAQLKGTPKQNLNAWQRFLDAVMVPDDNIAIEIMVEDWLPESLVVLELTEEGEFDDMIRWGQKLIHVKRTISNPRDE